MNYKSSRKVANNPQTFLNTYLSAMRNSIISFTLGIGIYGFSKTFNNQKSDLLMRLFSILLYIFSFGNAFNTSRMLQIYLKKVEKEKKSKKHPFPDYVSFKHWKNYLIMGYFFCFILVVLFILATKRFVVNLF